MRFILVCLVLLLFGGLYLHQQLYSSQSQNTIRWDMPTAYSDSNYHTQNAKDFALRVNHCTHGELDITVHGGGSLFKGHEIKRAVQTGQVQLGERLLSSHANENPLYAFDSIPFIASGFEQSYALYETALPYLTKLMAKKQLVMLYSVPWPPQGLYFKTPITNKADLKGVKFRSYNSATAQIAQLAGMVPAQIEAAELNQALALGVVSSMISSGSTGYDRKVWEQLEYFYDIKAWLPRSYVFANKASFDSLSHKHQQCLLSAAKQAQAKGNAKAEELSQWYLEQLAANGMQVLEPPGSLQRQLQQIGQLMTSQWVETMGEDGKQMLVEYQQTQGATHE